VVKFRLAGARALYLPPGGNPEAFANLPKVGKRHFVSFVGQCYGVRKDYIEHLRQHGIDVHVRGQGWPDGPVSHQEMLEIYAASHIILGFGFTGRSRSKTAIKGRDFEIPLTGTAYLTTRDPVLSRYFREGEEILFYRNQDDLLKVLRYYAGRTDELARIGQAGQRRALAEHGWNHRWTQTLGLLRRGLSSQ
jgi:spore maturation protein CgeB